MQRFTFRYVSKPHSQQLCVGQPSAAPLVLLRLLILVGLDLVAAARENYFSFSILDTVHKQVASARLADQIKTCFISFDAC